MCVGRRPPPREPGSSALTTRPRWVSTLLVGERLLRASASISPDAGCLPLLMDSESVKPLRCPPPCLAQQAPRQTQAFSLPRPPLATPPPPPPFRVPAMHAACNGRHRRLTGLVREQRRAPGRRPSAARKPLRQCAGPARLRLRPSLRSMRARRRHLEPRRASRRRVTRTCGGGGPRPAASPRLEAASRSPRTGTRGPAGPAGWPGARAAPGPMGKESEPLARVLDSEDSESLTRQGPGGKDPESRTPSHWQGLGGGGGDHAMIAGNGGFKLTAGLGGRDEGAA